MAGARGYPKAISIRDSRNAAPLPANTLAAVGPLLRFGGHFPCPSLAPGQEPRLLMLAARSPDLGRRCPRRSHHVFTRVDPSRVTDPKQRQRLQTVADLRKGLAKKRRQGRDAPAAGVLVLEVLENSRNDISHSPTTAARKERWPVVQVAIRIGDYEAEIKGSGKRWTSAADAITDTVDQWVQENRGQLAR